MSDNHSFKSLSILMIFFMHYCTGVAEENAFIDSDKTDFRRIVGTTRDNQEYEGTTLVQESTTPLFEGDIIPSWSSISIIYGEDFAYQLGLSPPPIYTESGKKIRGITEFDDLLWNLRDSNGKLYVPYEFIEGTMGPYTETEKEVIKEAFDGLSEMVGVIDFIPRTNERDYIQVKDNGSCASFIGKQGGKQMIDIGWCKTANYRGVMQHEIMHALGFYHEHSRPDRDDFIVINEDRISANMQINFAVATTIDSLESPYDYCSVMHYHPFAFSNSNVNPVIELAPGKTGCQETGLMVGPFGQRVRPSSLDISQIQQLYQCSDGPRTVSAALSNPCTNTCKCWLGASGCSHDSECFNDLKCENTVCVERQPTQAPSTVKRQPTQAPSTSPSFFPSSRPSTSTPTKFPSLQPWKSPTIFPSLHPSASPSSPPTSSLQPSSAPSMSIEPSSFPSVSMIPSSYPTLIPSLLPSISKIPSVFPSLSPSSPPTISSIPTDAPSLVPSSTPTEISVVGLFEASLVLNNVNLHSVSSISSTSNSEELDNTLFVCKTALLHILPQRSELTKLVLTSDSSFSSITAQSWMLDNNKRRSDDVERGADIIVTNMVMEFEVRGRFPCEGECNKSPVVIFYENASHNIDDALSNGSLEAFISEMAIEMELNVLENISIERNSFSMNILIPSDDVLGISPVPSSYPSIPQTNHPTFLMCRLGKSNHVNNLFRELLKQFIG